MAPPSPAQPHRTINYRCALCCLQKPGTDFPKQGSELRKYKPAKVVGAVCQQCLLDLAAAEKLMKGAVQKAKQEATDKTEQVAEARAAKRIADKRDDLQRKRDERIERYKRIEDKLSKIRSGD